MKVLINCYACSPYQGSEPGMGWNFVNALSRLYDLHIVTESKFKPDLDRYFAEHSDERCFYKFYFIQKDRHKTLRKIWPPSYYWFYKRWQKRALLLAQELDARENFDLIHQLNMVGYREPGYLCEMNKPLVWGPISGLNITPWNFLWTMGVNGFIHYAMRNMINILQMSCSRRVAMAMKRADALIGATSNDIRVIAKLWGRDSSLIPEVGLFNSTHTITPSKRVGRLKICWSGLHIYGKSLNLLLEAIACCKHKQDIELHIIGDGDNRHKWEVLAAKLGVENITWYGWVERSRAVEIMQQSHLFAITSMSEATSTVLLEALSFGLPVIAPNHCGFTNVITPECGIKIDLTNKKQFVEEYASAVDSICEDEKYRESLANGALLRANEFSWTKKIEEITSIYKQVATK